MLFDRVRTHGAPTKPRIAVLIKPPEIRMAFNVIKTWLFIPYIANIALVAECHAENTEAQPDATDVKESSSR